MQKFWLAASLTLLCCLPAWARPTRPALLRTTMTQDFEQVDLLQVVRALAKAMGRNAYIGPGVEGTVSVQFQSVPPEAALALVLAMQKRELAYKLIGKTGLVVATPDKIDQIDSETIGCRVTTNSFSTTSKRIRGEFLLDRAIAQMLLPKLGTDYPDVEFIPHRMNGFYAVGSREDLARLKTDLSRLDIEPPDLAEEVYEVEYQMVENTRCLVRSLAPTLSVTVEREDPSTLVLKGTPEDVETGLALLEQLDRPPDEICYDLRLVSIDQDVLKELLIYWTPNPRVGVSYRPCFGGPYSRLDFLSQRGKAKVLSSPRLTGTSGKECVQSIPELGLRVQLLGQVERRGRLQLSVALEDYKCEMPVEDGSVVILRGVIPGPDKCQETMLMICPMMMY